MLRITVTYSISCIPTLCKSANIFLSCPVDQEAYISEQMEDPVTCIL